MNKYAAKFPASTEKEYLRARERLVRLQTRLRETIHTLSYTKAGAPRKRVDRDALHLARSKKYEVEQLIRDLDAWWAAQQRKRKPASKPKAREPKPRASKVASNKKQQREIERLQRENERLRQAERERREDRKREREALAEEREEALRQEAILSGDYQALAELEGISDSEAYTEILYAHMEMGAAGVAA